MKKITILTLLGLVIFNCSFAQSSEKYLELIDEAWELYEDKKYLKSGQKYSETFVANRNKGGLDDRYNAACSWALANQPDSSFIQLFKISELGNFTNIEHITNDSDLNSLHADERWNEVIDIIKSNRKFFDEHLVSVLDTIYQKDQGYRFKADEIEEKYGRESEEMNAFVKIIQEQDSINVVKVTNILDERGWLGPDIIGNEGNLTLFLVIQHSYPETQEKYLPMMCEAVKKGNAHAAHLALLEDRVALGNGEKQIYGSQIGQEETTGEYYVLPLIDPDNVDKRRGEVGLGPIQDYIYMWGITWDLEAHKKRIIEFEASLDILQDTILDTIYKQDQNYRQQIDEIEQLYGSESEDMKANTKIMHENDSLNLIQIKNKVIDNWAAPSSPCFAEFKHPPEIKYRYKNKDAIFLLSRSYETFRASDWEKDAEKYILKGYLLDDRRIKGYY